jgi:S1-C subfamily serine protease
MKNLNRTILGVMASALLLSGFVLCNFGAQADVFYSKHGGWTVAYLELDNLNGCGAAARFPDQTVFQMTQIQSGTNKAWIIFISNPRWNAWIGKRKELRLSLVTDWPTTKPWPYTFSVSGDNKILSTTDASVEFMNSVADASKVEIMTDNKELLASVDMKDSAATIRAIVTCVNEHPPKSETIISGTGFFVAPKRVVTNNHVVSGCTKDIQVRYPDRRPYTATLSGQDPNNDLVLLQTDMDNLSTAAFESEPRLGDQVATYGFPYSGVLSSSGNCTFGNVTSLIGMKDDTRFLQMSAPVQPGNSGGALVNMSGSVVGVVVGQLSAIAKSVPQNVNFAIQPSIVINFLSVKGATPRYSSMTGTRKSPDEVCDIAQKFTVQVYCQGISPKTATGGSGPLVLSPSDVADFSTKLDAEPGRGSIRP